MHASQHNTFDGHKWLILYFSFAFCHHKPTPLQRLLKWFSQFNILGVTTNYFDKTVFSQAFIMSQFDVLITYLPKLGSISFLFRRVTNFLRRAPEKQERRLLWKTCLANLILYRANLYLKKMFFIPQKIVEKSLMTKIIWNLSHSYSEIFWIKCSPRYFFIVSYFKIE